MALASAEVSRQHAWRVWDETRSYDNYQNYVIPNLAPRALESGDLPRLQQLSWRDAPPPPPDPIGVLLKWMIRHPGIALVLAYSVWLVSWSLYAIQALSDV